MSETVSRDRGDGQQADAAAAGDVRRAPVAGRVAVAEPGGREAAAEPFRRRRSWFRGAVVGSLAVLVAAGVASAWYAGVFRRASPPGNGEGTAPAPATKPVTRQDISSTTPVTATLGYAGSYTVTGEGGGTLTWLPSAGKVIRQGHVLYRTGNGSPVVLLYGSVPDWRAMSQGDTGADVSQLNHDLVHLGYANRADIKTLGWDYFSWETRQGVERLEGHLGVTSPSGSVSLGQVVFEPEALRVSSVTGSLGGPAGGPVLKATSDRHVVTINLDASQQGEVTKGDSVTVTLPDGKSTPGVVSSVGRVAVTSGSGANAATTIPVQVKLSDPEAAGRLDQAPVTVAITTASVRDALVVPVGALLAQPSGGYAVEVTGVGNTRHLVPVKVGIFDDAAGLVQVTGALTPGERVVVPSS